MSAQPANLHAYLEAKIEGRIKENGGKFTSEILAEVRAMLQAAITIAAAARNEDARTWGLYSERHRGGMRNVLYDARGREVDLTTLPAPHVPPSLPASAKGKRS